MPSLNHLKIEYYWELEAIPDGLRFVTTLQELEIKGMPKLCCMNTNTDKTRTQRYGNF